MSNPHPREGTAYAARAALGGACISVAELARETSRSHAYWSIRLSGDKPLTVDDLVALAEITGVPVTDLVRGSAA